MPLPVSAKATMSSMERFTVLRNFSPEGRLTVYRPPDYSFCGGFHRLEPRHGLRWKREKFRRS